MCERVVIPLYGTPIKLAKISRQFDAGSVYNPSFVRFQHPGNRRRRCRRRHRHLSFLLSISLSVVVGNCIFSFVFHPPEKALWVVRLIHLVTLYSGVTLEKVGQENTHLLRKGKYHCTADLMFYWFGFSCFAYV